MAPVADSFSLSLAWRFDPDLSAASYATVRDLPYTVTLVVYDPPPDP